MNQKHRGEFSQDRDFPVIVRSESSVGQDTNLLSSIGDRLFRGKQMCKLLLHLVSPHLICELTCASTLHIHGSVLSVDH